PAVAGIRIFIKPDWAMGHRDGEANPFAWTHIALIPFGTDVRDGYAGLNVLSAPDSLYVPDSNGTRYTVMFVEREMAGSASDHLRVYLDRWAPHWDRPPTGIGEL